MKQKLNNNCTVIVVYLHGKHFYINGKIKSVKTIDKLSSYICNHFNTFNNVGNREYIKNIAYSADMSIDSKTNDIEFRTENSYTFNIPECVFNVEE